MVYNLHSVELVYIISKAYSIKYISSFCSISFSRQYDEEDGNGRSFTEPEIETTQEGFVSLQQERLMFPDTHL